MIIYIYSVKSLRVSLSNTEQEKKLAAIRSVDWVKNGMIVGLGTGSTSAYMIRQLGEEIRNGLSIRGVPSSENSAQLATNVGIPLMSLDEAGTLDINIDGADEFDPHFRLIKGGGGALLREKILAYNSKLNLIIADSGKQVKKLGNFKLPVETIPFATENIRRNLEEMQLNPIRRMQGGVPFRTDENNFILDIDISDYKDVDALNQLLINIPGVVETGLFLDTTDIIIMGKDGDTFVFEKDRK